MKLLLLPRCFSVVTAEHEAFYCNKKKKREREKKEIFLPLKFCRLSKKGFFSVGSNCIQSFRLRQPSRIFRAKSNLNVGRVAQSVLRLTTSWTLRDRIPVETRFSAHPDRPWGPPILL